MKVYHSIIILYHAIFILWLIVFIKCRLKMYCYAIYQHHKKQENMLSVNTSFQFISWWKRWGIWCCSSIWKTSSPNAVPSSPKNLASRLTMWFANFVLASASKLIFWPPYYHFCLQPCSCLSSNYCSATFYFNAFSACHRRSINAIWYCFSERQHSY